MHTFHSKSELEQLNKCLRLSIHLTVLPHQYSTLIQLNVDTGLNQHLYIDMEANSTNTP